MVLFPIGYLILITGFLLGVMTVGVVYQSLFEDQPFDARIIRYDLMWLGVFFIAEKITDWLDL